MVGFLGPEPDELAPNRRRQRRRRRLQDPGSIFGMPEFIIDDNGEIVFLESEDSDTFSTISERDNRERHENIEPEELPCEPEEAYRNLFEYVAEELNQEMRGRRVNYEDFADREWFNRRNEPDQSQTHLEFQCHYDYSYGYEFVMVHPIIVVKLNGSDTDELVIRMAGFDLNDEPIREEPPVDRRLTEYLYRQLTAPQNGRNGTRQNRRNNRNNATAEAPVPTPAPPAVPAASANVDNEA
ncbi:unnamed protein product [Caenorhabditis bovis]|uniref:Uncharacterized protein n=1 Tax=Caenorhabditis bovis TaxID=2654633 RepID=A0A8S1ECA9_9PELO|nr:unnamed protein product [Caenorhabditis bovis]